MRMRRIVLTAMVMLLVACSEHVSPPHALDDASTAAQRASAAMQTTSKTSTENDTPAK